MILKITVTIFLLFGAISSMAGATAKDGTEPWPRFILSMICFGYITTAALYLIYG